MKVRKVFIMLEVQTDASLSTLRNRCNYILAGIDSFTVEQVSANVNRDLLRGNRPRNKKKD